MSWVKIDDGAPEHRKQIEAGALACWLWMCGLAYCNRQKIRDGFIPAGKVAALYPMPNPMRWAARLVAVGLWDEVVGGFVIHDYHEYQPSAEKQNENTAKRSEAGRVGGQRSGAARRSKAEAKAEAESKHFASGLLQESKQTVEAKPNPDPVPDPEEPPNPPQAVGSEGGFSEPKPERPESLRERLEAAYRAAIETVSGARCLVPFDATDDRALGLWGLASGTGPRQFAELRASVATYRRATSDRGDYERGWRPTTWAEWRAAGGKPATDTPKQLDPRTEATNAQQLADLRAMEAP